MLWIKKKLQSKFRLVVFLLVLLGIFGGGFAAANNLLGPLFANHPAGRSEPDGAEKKTELPGMNVLIMAVDEREGNGSKLTDTMILTNINNKAERFAFLSIPRDTKVNLPGYGVNKINAANVYGGPEMAMEMVSDLTGVSVDYYVLTNFNGFKDIVDALGGVTIDVEKNMSHTERAYGGEYNINLAKGQQRLNGSQALGYARYRSDGLGDITRTQRQLKLLTAIGEEAMQPGTITKLPGLIDGIKTNMKTNMGKKQLYALAMAAKNLEHIQTVTQTLPGWFLDEDGVSYWYVDPDAAREVTVALFEEGRVVEVVKGAMVHNSDEKQVAMEQPADEADEEVDSDADAELDIFFPADEDNVDDGGGQPPYNVNGDDYTNPPGDTGTEPGLPGEDTVDNDTYNYDIDSYDIYNYDTYGGTGYTNGEGGTRDGQEEMIIR